MKITQSTLRKIIKEELKAAINEGVKPGTLLELTVSDDGYETSFTELGSAEEYTNTRAGAWAPSIKMLVKVLQVAPDPYADGDEAVPDAADDASWGS